MYKADFLSDEEYVDETRTKTMNEYVKEIINESKPSFKVHSTQGGENSQGIMEQDFLKRPESTIQIKRIILKIAK